MKKALLSLLLLFTSAQAQEAIDKVKITGAFGLKLGDEFDQSMVVVELSGPYNPYGPKIYYVDPPQKAQGINRYSVTVTPISNKIAFFFADRLYKNSNQCMNELAIYKERLTKKHGDFEKGYITLGNKMYTLKVGNRAIILLCTSFFFLGDATSFSIIYTDNHLYDLADKEQQRLDKETGYMDDSK